LGLEPDLDVDREARLLQDLDRALGHVVGNQNSDRIGHVLFSSLKILDSRVESQCENVETGFVRSRRAPPRQSFRDSAKVACAAATPEPGLMRYPRSERVISRPEIA